MNRVFKIVKNKTKKRIYISLEDFNKYCLNAKIPYEWTLYRYLRKFYNSDIEPLVECFEKIEWKWIKIEVEVWVDYK